MFLFAGNHRVGRECVFKHLFVCLSLRLSVCLSSTCQSSICQRCGPLQATVELDENVDLIICPSVRLSACQSSICQSSIYQRCSYLQASIEFDENVDLSIDVASVCYTHSPRFIKELDETATEFKNYITQFKDSLKVRQGNK